MLVSPATPLPAPEPGWRETQRALHVASCQPVRPLLARRCSRNGLPGSIAGPGAQRRQHGLRDLLGPPNSLQRNGGEHPLAHRTALTEYQSGAIPCGRPSQVAPPPSPRARRRQRSDRSPPVRTTDQRSFPVHLLPTDERPGSIRPRDLAPHVITHLIEYRWRDAFLRVTPRIHRAARPAPSMDRWHRYIIIQSYLTVLPNDARRSGYTSCHRDRRRCSVATQSALGSPPRRVDRNGSAHAVSSGSRADGRHDTDGSMFGTNTMGRRDRMATDDVGAAKPGYTGGARGVGVRARSGEALTPPMAVEA
jgi:hypothetical protein